MNLCRVKYSLNQKTLRWEIEEKNTMVYYLLYNIIGFTYDEGYSLKFGENGMEEEFPTG